MGEPLCVTCYSWLLELTPDSAGLPVPRAKRNDGDVYRLEETEIPKGEECGQEYGI